MMYFVLFVTDIVKRYHLQFHYQRADIVFHTSKKSKRQSERIYQFMSRKPL